MDLEKRHVFSVSAKAIRTPTLRSSASFDPARRGATRHVAFAPGGVSSEETNCFGGLDGEKRNC